jgi:pimeloyl-ACP methyl ester carboxylesterase
MGPDPRRLRQVIELPDGRTLGFAEYGPPSGVPVFLFHGLPGSRLAVQELWDEDPRFARVIAPDRPGVGLSAFQAGRRLTDWAADVAHLADSLGIDRFAVAGFSAGGPHALVAAHGLGARVVGVGIIAGAGPPNPGTLRGLRPTMRIRHTVVQRVPTLARALAERDAWRTRRHPVRLLERAAASSGLPAGDRAALSSPRRRDLEARVAPEAFRQGGRGVAQESSMLARPWGFDPAAVRVPVHFWHGREDVNVPVTAAEGLAGRIATSTLTVLPDEGHLIVPRHWDEILAALVSFGSSEGPRRDMAP